MISDVTRAPGKYIYETKDHVTKLGSELSRYLPKGTLILSNSGSIGIPKILGVDGCIHDGFVTFLDMPPDISVDYLYYYFSSITQNLRLKHKQGITQTNLNTKIVNSLPVPLCETSEQVRIVAKIEELFQHLRTAGQELENVSGVLSRFRQSILDAAFRGKLTKTNHGALPGTELLKQADRYDSWFQASKIRRNGRRNNMGDNVLPPGWASAHLGDICQPTETVNPRDEPAKAFRYVDIASIDNERNVISSPKTIAGRDAPTRARQKIRKNDTLFSTVRTYLKNIALVPEEYDGEVSSTGFCVIRPMPFMNPGFIYYYVLSDQFVSDVTPTQTGILYPATKDSIIFNQLTPVPPRDEQDKIVNQLKRLLGMARVVQDTSQTASTIIENSKQAILSRAFRGELIPQDPNGESAHVLIGKIRGRLTKR
jgi:type I restriction enzyme S subunit